MPWKMYLGMMALLTVMLAVLFILAWSSFFYLWTFVFGLPVGPGSPTYYPPV